MKTVVVSICNSLMAVSISGTLQRMGGFAVHSIKTGSGVVAACRTEQADIVLMEAAYNPGFTMDERLSDARLLKAALPSCKVLLLCDENSAPELARKVAQAKRNGLIDEFIYSSVSESYLTAVMDTM